MVMQWSARPGAPLPWPDRPRFGRHAARHSGDAVTGDQRIGPLPARRRGWEGSYASPGDVNVSSIAGLFGNGDRPIYSASKGGLTALTCSLAHRLGQ
jgi:NAD(P)-dependent dehydrogenase (short-subunit alcohol dehydrogenase family)